MERICVNCRFGIDVGIGYACDLLDASIGTTEVETNTSKDFACPNFKKK